MTKGRLRWLFQDCEVMHFNGGRIINLREERNEKRRWGLGRSWGVSWWVLFAHPLICWNMFIHLWCTHRRPTSSAQGESKQSTIQVHKPSHPRATARAAFCFGLEKGSTLPAHILSFKDEGVLGTHLKLKKLGIQWNKFEVIWRSFAQSNYATKSSYLDSAPTTR